MNIKTDGHETYFCANHPSVDARRRLSFNSQGCTHFLIESCSMENEPDIRVNGILEQLGSLQFSQLETGVVKGLYTLRIVPQPAYVAAGNFVQMDTKSTCHAVYGCIYRKEKDELEIYLPEKPEDSQAYIPLTVQYDLKKVMTPAKPGCLGIGRKEEQFTGYFLLRIDQIPEYHNGSIYYTMGKYRYFITKEMLGKSLYIKADDSKRLPDITNTVKGISLVKR